jgi:hypothetical protein
LLAVSWPLALLVILLMPIILAAQLAVSNTRGVRGRHAGVGQGIAFPAGTHPRLPGLIRCVCLGLALRGQMRFTLDAKHAKTRVGFRKSAYLLLDELRAGERSLLRPRRWGQIDIRPPGNRLLAGSRLRLGPASARTEFRAGPRRAGECIADARPISVWPVPGRLPLDRLVPARSESPLVPDGNDPDR